MRLLLDTHAFLWFIWGNKKLSGAALALLCDPNNELILSTVSMWEIALKVSIGKLKLADAVDVFLNDAIADNGLTVLPVSVDHAATLSTLPLHHRDPFDRMLVAQAVVQGIPLVSGDPQLDAYGIKRLW